MRRRAAAIAALAIPAVIVATVTVLLFTRDRTPAACPELDVPLGEVAQGPRGWTAHARYEQWAEAGQCLGSLGVSFFSPGDSWEAEAWSPAAHVVVRGGLLPPPTRARAWLAWSDDGRPLLFGFGEAATPIIADALPDAAGGASFHRCAIVEAVRRGDEVDWSRVHVARGECVALPLSVD